MPGTEFQANASGNTELASQLQASITALVAAQAQAGNLSSSLQPLASVTNEGSVQLPTLDTNALTQTITQISTAYESIESSFAKLSTKLPEIQKQLDQLSNIKLPENAMSQLKDNVDKINAGMKVLDQGLTTVSKNMGLLDKSTDSLSTAADGINTLLGGFKQLNGYNQTLLDGASKLKANSPSLVAGINTLAGGTDELASGLNTLGSQLCSGSEHSQQTVLHFETVLPHSFPEQQSFPKAEPYCKMEVSAKDGITQLQDGARTLKDGMQEFNEQGTRKLKDTVEKELGNILDRLESLTSDQCSYDTFSGKAKDMEGNVKFVIETDAIK